MKTQFRQVVRESDICVICGERVATTKEHVPSRGLFRTRPREYLSVPACEVCNNSTKLDDQYLQQAMASSSLVGEGIEVYWEKVSPQLRAFPKTKLALRNRITTKNLNMSEAGTVRFSILGIDPKRINISIRKLVAGLYWFHSGKQLPSKTQLELKFINVAELPEYFADSNMLAIFRTTQRGIYVNNEVTKTFSYWWLITESYSLWYFFFYKQNAVVVFASLPSTEDSVKNGTQGQN